jgi:hypothetical protein
MARPKFNINDLIAGAGGGGAPPPPDLSGGAAPIGGPPMGVPMGAGALPPAPELPPVPAAKPRKRGGRKKGK